MTHRVARLVVVVAVAAAAVWACQTDRDRPGPPRVGIVFNQDSVHSPDTLTGSVRADDPDGIDSIWLSIDSGPPLGADGLLDPTFIATFRADVPAGHVLGDHVSVRLTARDISGYVGGLDTFVVVKGP
jgi:hypothetical protein